MSLADQALANLVDQFARPLDFLRELAQNAIDAGSPRIEVTVAFEPDEGADEGVLTIAVRDFGEGMDEAIIDHQLTRLFASSKEDDLTKIGKFGIGFTSVFALRPEAVLVRTGRHGENWELLFHADRTFDKVRIDEPVAGTTVTLFKRMPATRAEALTADCEATLRFWCEHSDTPILFQDARAEGPAPTVDDDDPFAAFEDDTPADGAPINRPLDLDAPLRVRREEDGITVVLGAGSPPRYSFYSGGLTLLSTSSEDALGEHARTLRHLTFKLKSDRLEHTLTRDNVIQDEAWARAMEVVGAARTDLRAELLDRLQAAVARGDLDEVDQWQRVVAAELVTEDGPAWLRGQRERTLWLGVDGRGVSTKDLGTTRPPEVLFAARVDPLVEAVRSLGMPILLDRPPARMLAWHARGGTGRSSSQLRDVGDVFVLPQVVSPDALVPLERQLVERVRDLLRVAVGMHVDLPGRRRWTWSPGEESWANRLDLKVGDFGGLERGTRDVLALNGPKDGRVMLRPRHRRRWLPAFLRWRTLLVNRRHPLFRSAALATADDPFLAAFGLAQALLHAEDLEGERAYQRLLHRATEAPR